MDLRDSEKSDTAASRFADVSSDEMPSIARSAGVSDEQFIAFSALMRRPIYEWLTPLWDRTTRKIPAESGQNRELALRNFESFLSAHPHIPIVALRSLITDVFDVYFGRSADQRYKEKRIHVDLFMDCAATFFQERANGNSAVSVDSERAGIRGEVNTLMDGAGI